MSAKKSQVVKATSKIIKKPPATDAESKLEKQISYNFDANAHTPLCSEAMHAVGNYINMAINPGSDSKTARPVKKMIQDSIDGILALCHTSTADYTCVFTSGATESNSFVLRSVVKAFNRKAAEHNLHIKPHVITSSTEHNSILSCLEDLEKSGEVEVTYIGPTIYGNIKASDIKAAIKKNTCLISIIYAGNELPIINNITDIATVARENNIPLHTDAVQIFGKYPVRLDILKLDALTATAHKFGGPLGIGVVILKNKFIDSYELTGEINGTQQCGLRGGTENPAGIAGFAAALKASHKNRQKKTEKMMMFRMKLIDALNGHIPFVPYENYINETKHGPLELVSLGPPLKNAADGFLLSNTVLLSVAKNVGKPFCNVLLKHFLDAAGCVVSIGSACLTKNKSASHVLTAIKAPDVIKRGVIRISFHDKNDNASVDFLVKKIIDGIKKQCSDIESQIEKQGLTLFAK